MIGPRFTLRQVHYFVAVAEFGSISRASEAINISPPSLSTAIAQLEATFGIQLFVRKHAQALSLTMAGRRFLGGARQLLSQASIMHRSASDMADRLAGPVCIGCQDELAPILLPAIRRHFVAANADVEWNSATGNDLELAQKLRAGEIDVALADDLLLPDDLAYEPLADLPAHVILPAGHDLARESSICLAALARQPLILVDRQPGRDYVLGLFSRAGLEPRIGERVDDAHLMRALVAEGLGYGIGINRPANSAAADGRPVVVKALADPHRPVTIGALYLREAHRPRLVRRFLECCHDLIRDDHLPGMAPPPMPDRRVLPIAAE